jgi:hypothetical protein
MSKASQQNYHINEIERIRLDCEQEVYIGCLVLIILLKSKGAIMLFCRTSQENFQQLQELVIKVEDAKSIFIQKQASSVNHIG